MSTAKLLLSLLLLSLLLLSLSSLIDYIVETPEKLV